MNVNECNILTNEFGEFEGDVMELNNPGVIDSSNLYSFLKSRHCHSGTRYAPIKEYIR